MSWPFRHWGSAGDPIHPSQLAQIVGDFGCPKQFWYRMEERASRGELDLDERDTVPAKAALGTAAHETIARALLHDTMRDALLSGKHQASRENIARVFDEELQREVGHREMLWFGADPAEEIANRITMIVGLLNGLHRYVAEVVLIEPGFICRLDDYWLSGHVDLVYRPRSNPAAIALCDWKTGANKPSLIELAHSWQAWTYSAAVYAGHFVPREQITVERAADGRSVACCGSHEVRHWSRYLAERTVSERAMIDLAQTLGPREASRTWTPERLRDDNEYARECGAKFGLRVQGFAEYPAEVFYVHMADYVPYKRAGKKTVKRPEDLAHYGYASEAEHGYKAGDERGPAWLPCRLTEHDVPRLSHRLRNVVGMVRMGRFIDQIGDRCVRCPYAGDCLSAGYAPRGDAQRDLERSLRVLPALAADSEFDLND